MSKLILAAAAAAVAIPMAAATPASAQPYGYANGYRQQVRDCNQDLRSRGYNGPWIRDLGQCRRFAHRSARADWRAYRNYDYNRADPAYNGYYADRYYRDGQYYQQRQLSYDDRVYRGQNGQYYCRRSDGTTGLIVGGIAGGVLGNILPIGGSSTLRTIVGGAAGAAIGSSVDRGRVVCR